MGLRKAIVKNSFFLKTPSPHLEIHKKFNQIKQEMQNEAENVRPSGSYSAAIESNMEDRKGQYWGGFEIFPGNGSISHRLQHEFFSNRPSPSAQSTIQPAPRPNPRYKPPRNTQLNQQPNLKHSKPDQLPSHDVQSESSPRTPTLTPPPIRLVSNPKSFRHS